MFPYSQPLGIEALGLQIKILGAKYEALGFQVNHTRYNVGLLRILWQMTSDGNTANNYTASSSASVDKDILNIKSDITEQYWQSLTTTEWFVFDCGAGRTMQVDTFALIDTNITNSAVIKIKAFGDANSAPPPNWAVVPYLVTVPMSSDPLERNIIYISPTQPLASYRYFRVEITDTTNTAGFLRIGRCIAGSSLVFTTENCLDAVSYKKENYKDEFSINGFTSIANNRALKKNMTISFANLNRMQFVNYRRLMEYVTYCRDTLKALVIIDPQEPYQFSVFSKLKAMPEESHQYISSDTMNTSLSLSYDEGR
jgi:hypothetical protein